MKIRYLFILAAGVGMLAFPGCEKQPSGKEVDDGLEPLSFTAASPAPKQIGFVWPDHSQITLFDADGAREFNIASGAGSATAVFEGRARKSTSYYAAYPYSSSHRIAAAIEGKDISLSIPQNQTASKGISGFTAVGRVSSNAIKFHSVGAHIGIPIPESGVTSMSLSSPDGLSGAVALCGEITVNGLSGTWSLGKSTASNITVQGDFKKGEICYVTVLPGQSYNGLYVSMKTASASKMFADAGFTGQVENGGVYLVSLQGMDYPSISAIDWGCAAWDLIAGESFTPDLQIEYQGSTYRLGDRDFGIVFSSSAPSVANISSDGVITAVAKGRSIITATSPDGSISKRLEINVIDPTVFGSTLTSSMIYTSGQQLVTNSVMQSFSFGEGDYMYFNQVAAGTANNHNNILSRRQLKGSSYEYMRLSYFGHGQNLYAESDQGNTYCWLPCYGTKDTGGDYINAQTIARIRFSPGTTIKAADTQENYWIPNCRNLQVSIDEANDMMMVYSVGTSINYHIYRWSDAKKLTPVMKTLSYSITSGGEAGGPSASSGKPSISVKDLSTLTPISEFGAITGKQGYELHNGKIYIYEGTGNDNDGKTPSSATVYVLSLAGKTLRKIPVQAASDMSTLSSLGLSDTGYLEAEGLKVKDGAAYLGFASKGSDEIRRAVILKYPLF